MMTQTMRRNPLAQAAEVHLASDAATPELSIADANDLLYDYKQIAEDNREVVIWAAVDIKRSVRRMASVIGERLTEVKNLLPHGQWTDWLRVEFEWTERSAENMMNAARLVAKNEKFSVLSNSVQYLLGAPSTPEPAREAVLEVAAKGEKVTHQVAKAIVDAHKPPKPTPVATLPPERPQTPVEAFDERDGVIVPPTQETPVLPAATVPNQGQTGARSVPSRKPSPDVDEPDISSMIDDTERLAGRYAEAEEWFKRNRRAALADQLCALRHAMYEAIKMMEGE